jgi:hypothetical protein
MCTILKLSQLLDCKRDRLSMVGWAEGYQPFQPVVVLHMPFRIKVMVFQEW